MSGVSGKMPTVNAAERERRNAQVLQLFLGGASHRTIARVVGCGRIAPSETSCRRLWGPPRIGVSC